MSCENGACTAEFQVNSEQTNIIGGLHGGFSATVVDVISSLALGSKLGMESHHVSVDLSLS